MAAPVGAAVEAGDRAIGAVETRHQPIGPVGRPRLQHPKLPDAALLRRLQRRPAGAQAGRDPIDRRRSRRSCAGDSGLRSTRTRRAGCAARTERARSHCRRRATVGWDRREGFPAPARGGRRRRARCASARCASSPRRRSNRLLREGRRDRPDLPASCVRPPLAGSSRHTEPEAFFSIRSRFQSAGPFVAEPLATSSAPSRAGASAVMHLISASGGDRLAVMLAAEKTMLPSTRPTAAPPSGNPAKALISASKEASGALSGLSTREQRTSRTRR